MDQMPQNETIGQGAAPAKTVTLSTVREVAQRCYGEEIWRAVRAGIGVVAALSLKQRDHCLVLVFEGASGRGKSICTRLLLPDRPSTEAVLCRVDDFTPAAFVSHAANRSGRELEQIDLLPRMRGKVMLTKELAPLFRDNEKEQRQAFARLTSILDGNGYKTSSGTHGMRGYEGRYIFHWLGATTPIPERTHRLMAQLGNRLLFYELEGTESTEDELMKFAQNYEGNDDVEQCRKVVNDFLEAYFQQNPVESVDPGDVGIAEGELRKIVRYAQLIAHGRVVVEQDDWKGDVEVGAPEGPQRLILLLRTLAQGLALAEGRREVVDEDVAVIRYVAFSSIPEKRRRLLRALVEQGEMLETKAVMEAQGVSKPTALNRMRELAATSLATFTPGEEKSSTSAKIELAEEWTWLRDDAAPQP